ncbi:MAG: Rdx family protein [Actinomycetota bacterium]
MNIKITYCYDCGYTDQALDLVRKLLNDFDDRIAELTLIPASDGIFDVEVDGKMVHSKHKSGWFPEYDKLKAALS